MYRQRESSTRCSRRSDGNAPTIDRLAVGSAALAVWVFGLAVLLGGCAASPEPPDDVSVVGKSNEEILYEAILESFDQRGLAVEHASMEFRVVTSQYRPVNDRLRRRFTARIVPLPSGASALRVRAQHQRKRGGDDSGWKTVESDALRDRAAPDELELGRAIERRYLRWKEYADSRDESADGADESEESSAESDAGEGDDE